MLLEQQEITQVPQTPEHILGIINFRGETLPVIDTRRRFNLPAKADKMKNYVIVFEFDIHGKKLPVASTADAVKDVIEINPNDIKPVPEMGISFDKQYVSGVIKRKEKFILLLDTEKLFTIADVEALSGLT